MTKVDFEKGLTWEVTQRRRGYAWRVLCTRTGQIVYQGHARSLAEATDAVARHMTGRWY